VLNLLFDESLTPKELYTSPLVALILKGMMQMILVFPNMHLLCASPLKCYRERGKLYWLASLTTLLSQSYRRHILISEGVYG
jgi:hypothetical protein